MMLKRDSSNICDEENREREKGGRERERERARARSLSELGFKREEEGKEKEGEEEVQEESFTVWPKVCKIEPSQSAGRFVFSPGPDVATTGHIWKP